MATAPTVFILHGEDSLRQKKQLDRFRKQMGADETATLNIHELDGETSSVSEILAAATALPFLSERRLVIVRGLLGQLVQRGGAKKALDQLLAALPNLPSFTRLIFVEDSELKANHPIIRFAQDSETAHIQHNTVARDLSGWLQRRVRSEYGAEIEPIAARALATVVGKDLRRADNELLKLVSYTNGERRITEADVALMTPYVAPANIFHMVDALATGKGRAAMHRLQELLAERERDPIMLFGMIIRQFRLLVLAKEHLESGAGDDMAKALRVHPFVAQKLREQAHRYSLSQLEAIYRHLHERDVAIKTGELGAALALEMLVSELTARDAVREN